jgi:23S rRNA (guanosine2251-2'-O)-methyltransferase
VRIHGVHPVLEALRAGTVRRVRVAERSGDRLRELLDLAAAQGVRVERLPHEAIERLAPGTTHQGVVADVESDRAVGLRELAAGPSPLIVVLDGIEDPHNLGAIVRTADAAGVSGVVVQTRRSALHAGTVAKTSVVNIARAIEELKELGVWSVGLAGEASQTYDGIDLTGPIALVMGAEGPGLRRLVREKCDFLASIPMAGHVGSLNVSVAAGIALFEAVRQRRQANRPASKGQGG